MKRTTYGPAILGLWLANYNTLRLLNANHHLMPFQLVTGDTIAHIAPNTILLWSLVPLLLGVWATIARLQALNWPIWLGPLHAIPWIGVPFSLALMFIPAPSEKGDRLLDSLIPRDATGSALFAMLFTSFAAAPFVAIVLQYNFPYGWTIFVLIPFSIGMLATAFHTHYAPRTLMGGVGVSLLSVAMLGLVLLSAAIDGALCILMAAPIAMMCAVVGSVAVHTAQRHFTLTKTGAPLGIFLMFFIPTMMGAESAAHLTPPVWTVHTVIEINAPPDRVWQYVIAFPPAPPPQELLFRAGIAYPIQARIHGSGVGAMRTCDFSTGSFIETIDAWEPARRMEFSITAEADPMTEMTPYSSIHPAHLDGYLHPMHASFVLVPLPGGRTRLEGTSYYRDAIWPAQYWRFWSDEILHTVHRRVFEHVKRLAEGAKEPT